MIALLDKKSVLKKCSIAAVGATLSFAAIFFTVRMIHDSITRAITGDGATVTVSYVEDDKIWYGDYFTNRFSVESDSGPNNQTLAFTAFCAMPSAVAPASGEQFNAVLLDDSDENKLIKLMAYMYTTNNEKTSELMNDLFPNALPYDRYVYAQATIGYIYNNGDTGYLDGNAIAVIETAVGKLRAIPDNDDIWLMAKNYKLFKTAVSDDTTQAMVWIEDANTYGNITVQKRDSGTHSNTPQGGGSLEGITFSVYNFSGGRIYNPNDGNFYNHGALITRATTDRDGKVTFSNLPANILYRVQETGTNNSYLATAAAQNTTLTSGATNTLVFEDDIVRGDVKFTKKDNNGEPMANVVFRIQSNSYPYEYHFVISDESGVVDTSNQHAQHTYNTNGYDDMDKYGLTYLGYGTWFGEAPVDNSKGALPYDSYTITEWKCNANKFCQNTNLPQKIFYINKDTIGDNLLYELDDWENECADFSLSTTATDDKDGDKFIEASGDTIIKDTVKYCAKPGMEYTIKGILMDKSTSEALSVSGKTIESEVAIEPTEACGTVEMNFEVDTTELEGKEIVVFENMYYGEELVASHGQFDDEGQTVRVVSLSTIAKDNADGDKFLVADQEAKIMDEIKYCFKKDTNFTIKGILMDKSTGEPLRINGETVENSINLRSETECGQTEMTFTFDASELGGKELVVYETLYYGDDIIVEHEDINDSNQTVTTISLGTFATNKETEEKLLPLDEDVVVKDDIKYCLKPGETYTANGVLMDKSTGDKLLIDDKPVEAEITFTPKEACGTVTMDFEFNTKDLGGVDLVVFESLYHDDKLILEHHDLENEDETVSVAPPTPDTGFVTKSASNGGNTINMLYVAGSVVVLSVGGYCTYRHSARRKFMKKH